MVKHEPCPDHLRWDQLAKRSTVNWPVIQWAPAQVENDKVSYSPQNGQIYSAHFVCEIRALAPAPAENGSPGEEFGHGRVWVRSWGSMGGGGYVSVCVCVCVSVFRWSKYLLVVLEGRDGRI